MRYIRTYEYYASDRMRRRRYEEWSKLSNKKKREKYDAEVQFKKITSVWDKGQPWYAKEPYWSIQKYYGDYAKSVFLSSDSNLLNMWARGNRDSSNYDDGLEKDFAKWLKKNKYYWSWDSLTNQMSWDGIHIVPKDTEGLYWYYEELAGVKPKLFRERKQRPDKVDKEIKEIIELFRKEGYNITDANSIGNDSDSSDRYEFDYDYEGMTVRFYILKNDNLFTKSQKNYLNAVKEQIENMEEHFSEYLPDIKYVYEYCKNIAEGELWTMPGGGGQLQQFYGDDEGYLCILYMGMRGEKDDRVCSLRAQRNKNKFKDFDKRPLEKFAEFRKEVNKYNL